MKNILAYLVRLFFFFIIVNVHAQPLTRKVLFLGNSYTYVNNLPLLIANAAGSMGDSLIYDNNTPGGYTLYQHSQDVNSTGKIALGNWDFVVMQEQSQLPSFQDYIDLGVSDLCSLIKQYNPCARKMFYMTWGRKNGDQSNCASWPPSCTYLGMDSMLRLHYTETAITYKAEISPVGAVWRYIRQNFPTIDLYQPDESHPSEAGSYAAACCFYAAIFKKDPTLITYDFTLNAMDAANIRSAAKLIMYDSLPNWDFGDYNPVADFGFTIGNGINEVNLTNKSLNADSLVWDFGDTFTSTLDNPIHNYISDGTYTITLTASKCDLGILNTDTHTVNVTFCSHTPIVIPDTLLICPNAQDTLWTQVFDSYQWLDSNGNSIPNETNQYLVPGNENFYSVKATLNNCSEISRQSYVEYFTTGFVIYRVDSFSNSVNPDTLCQGDTVRLILNSNKPYSQNIQIQWSENGIPMMNAKDDTLMVVFSGSYNVKLIDPACPNYTVFESIPLTFNFNNCSIGIDESQIHSMINVFSDLSERNLYIRVNPILFGSDYIIFDVLGKIIQQGKFENEIINLSSKEINSGLYFLKVVKYNGQEIKFIFNNF